MDNQTVTEAPQTEGQVTKTVIRPNMANYVPDKSGSGKRTHRTDDFVARSLAGKSVDEVKERASTLGIDVEKWAHLNPGQQRMLIGNRLRTLMKARENPLTEEAITAVFGEPVPEYDAEAAAAAKQAAAEERARKKAEKAQKDAEKAAVAEEQAADPDAEPDADSKPRRRRK